MQATKITTSSGSKTVTLQASNACAPKLAVDAGELKSIGKDLSTVLKDDNALFELLSKPEAANAFKELLKAKTPLKRGAELVKEKAKKKKEKTEQRKQSEKDFADEFADMKGKVSEKRLKDLAKECDKALELLGVEVINDPIHNTEAIHDHLQALYLDEQASGIVNIIKRERADRFIYTIKKAFIALGKTKEEWLMFYAEQLQSATKLAWESIKRNHAGIQLIREYPRLIATGDFGWIKLNKVKLEQQIENDKSFWKAFAEKLDMQLGFSYGNYKIETAVLNAPLNAEGYKKQVEFEQNVEVMDIDTLDVNSLNAEQLLEIANKLSKLNIKLPQVSNVQNEEH